MVDIVGGVVGRVSEGATEGRVPGGEGSRLVSGEGVSSIGDTSAQENVGAVSLCRGVSRESQEQR